MMVLSVTYRTDAQEVKCVQIVRYNGQNLSITSFPGLSPQLLSLVLYSGDKRWGGKRHNQRCLIYFIPAGNEFQIIIGLTSSR